MTHNVIAAANSDDIGRLVGGVGGVDCAWTNVVFAMQINTYENIINSPVTTVAGYEFCPGSYSANIIVQNIHTNPHICI